MRLRHVPVFALASVALAVAAGAQDADRVVADGGIKVPGWMGKADGSGKVEEAKLVTMGPGMHVTTGPAIAYWNPANTATGNYTVKATFTEREYMGLNNHAHPYGIVIGGNDMGTENQSYLYCAAYGNGNFIVRGFGPAPFAMNGGRQGQMHDAVNKAAGKGQPVTQEIAVTVSSDKVTCSINGTEVASYTKAELVTAGKLKSTDGVYGFRFGHNTDAHIANFAMTKGM
jgi:hypothetical protein